VVYGLTEGMDCEFTFQCGIEFVCGSETQKCERIPIGTPCTSSSECLTTQDCLCAKGSNTASLECVDNGDYLCAEELQNWALCYNEYDCSYYDILNTTNVCYKNCHQIRLALECCQTCSYLPFNSDNAFMNLAGKCADNTVSRVECCDNAPCTILTAAALCEGYKPKKLI